MKTKSKRILSVALILFVACCSLSAWGVVRVVSWARDLPNRIVIDIDGDALADSFGAAVVQSYHEALASDDPQAQRNVIRDFSDAIADDSNARTWIRAEYSDDLTHLSSSSNADVAEDVARLLADMQDANDAGGE